MRTCNSCGNTEPENARFCGSCGSALDLTLASAGAGPVLEQPVDGDVATTATSVLELDPETSLASSNDVLDRTAELPRVHQPVQSPESGLHGGAGAARRQSRSRAVLIAPAVALLLAAAGVLAILLINSHSGSTHPRTTSKATSYPRELGATFGSVVSANQALSAALQALDGSKKTIAAAQSATSQAQSAVSAARGAIGVLPAPSSETTLSQQAQQALTEESGYLQALASTLSNPSAEGSSQLRPLITATQTAMVPLGQVAPGATSSLGGIDNVLSWAAGASALAQAARDKAQQQTPPASVPSGSPPGLTACDQNISVNATTSCQFADNVFEQYAQDVQQGGGPASYPVDAYSPATGQDYTDNCNYDPANQIVLCSHGSDLIQFPYWAAEAY